MTARSRLLAYAALALLSAALFLPGQASLPPFDRDEARYAQATVNYSNGRRLDLTLYAAR